MANSKYGRILAITTSVCAALLGILFIIGCAHLYFTGGENPYSRARVGEYLIWFIAPSAITLLLAIGGIIYNIITGNSDVRNSSRTSSEMLEGFSERYELSSFDSETQVQVKAIRKKKRCIDLASSMLTAVCFVFALDYLLFIAKFTIDTLNADVIAALAVALPLSAIGVAIHIPRIYFEEKSCEKELALLKESIKNNGAPKAKAKPKNCEKKVDHTLVIRYVIVGASLLLVILGIANGGMADVLAKAVKICTECIGLG